jgi:hypothetical protein
MILLIEVARKFYFPWGVNCITNTIYNNFANSKYIVEKALHLNQGPSMDALMKKKLRVENLVTLSFHRVLTLRER